jgi:hypothetical protein
MPVLEPIFEDRRRAGGGLPGHSAVRLVDRVCQPAFVACNHVACVADILSGVVLAVEPPAPPHSDVACEMLPGRHEISPPSSALLTINYRQCARRASYQYQTSGTQALRHK